MPSLRRSATLPVLRSSGDDPAVFYRAAEPLRFRGSRPVTWLLVAVAVPVEWAVTLLAVATVTSATAGSCNEPAQAADLHAAQRALLLISVTAAVPWLMALTVAGRRLRVAGFAALAVPPAAFWMSQTFASSPADFTNSFCLY
jgi:hypothetical protein